MMDPIEYKKKIAAIMNVPLQRRTKAEIIKTASMNSYLDFIEEYREFFRVFKKSGFVPSSHEAAENCHQRAEQLGLIHK